MASSGDPDPLSTVAVGIAGTLTVVVIVLLLQVLYYRAEQSEMLSKLYSEPPHALLQLQAEQLERLRTYKWVDKSAGVVAIPIGRAMDLVAHEQAGGAREGSASSPSPAARSPRRGKS